MRDVSEQVRRGLHLKIKAGDFIILTFGEHQMRLTYDGHVASQGAFILYGPPEIKIDRTRAPDDTRGQTLAMQLRAAEARIKELEKGLCEGYDWSTKEIKRLEARVKELENAQ